MGKKPLNRRFLIVGEGYETEYNYFVGLRKFMQKDLEDTATHLVVARGKGGNAGQIVQRAIDEYRKEKKKGRRVDRVFLLMDTEGVGRQPELPAAERLAEKNGIEIVYSSPAIEYWLLCHFEETPRNYFKDSDSVVVELNKKFSSGRIKIGQYDKADPDLFDRLSDKLVIACDQALEIDLAHQKSNPDAVRVNPSTQVYELVALLIGVRTGRKCPLNGAWEPLCVAGDKIKVSKGEKMPSHNGQEVVWKFVAPLSA